MKSPTALAYRKSLQTFCAALKKHNHFILSCHVLPEGDAIGSIFAMDSLLRRLGKKTTIVADDDFPKRLYSLSPKRWNRVDRISKSVDSFKALVVADCPNLSRIGKVQQLVAPETVIFNIDHHISNENYGDYNCVNPKAAASGEVVYDIFKTLRMPIHREEAENLYVALATDTGSFRYSNTTVTSHQIASELLSKGINLEKLNHNLYDTFSVSKIQLYSKLLGRVKTAAGGKIAWAAMQQSDLNETGAIDEDAEGFIDFLRSIREVRIAFFLMELPQKGKIRISFRSHGPYDVNKIAVSFDGGGHRKASGCVLPMSLHEAETAVLGRIAKIYRLV